MSNFFSPALMRTLGSGAADSAPLGWAVCRGLSCAGWAAAGRTAATWAAAACGGCRASATGSSSDTSRRFAPGGRFFCWTVLQRGRGETDQRLLWRGDEDLFFFIRVGRGENKRLIWLFLYRFISKSHLLVFAKSTLQNSVYDLEPGLHQAT